MLNKEKIAYPSFATVAVSVPTGPKGELTYRIPEELRDRLTPGMCVVVPVSSRKITGIVTCVGIFHDLPSDEKVKNILDILDEDIVFSEDLVSLWRWASNYYLSSPGEMLGTILPSGMRSRSVKIVKLKKSKRGSRKSGTKSAAIEEDTVPVHDSSQTENLAASEKEVLSFLAEKTRVTTKTLRQRFPPLSLEKILHRLEMLEFIEVKEHFPRQRRPPVQQRVPEFSSHETTGKGPSFSLSAFQERASRPIVSALQAAAFHVFLLHGVTGSGKTEVYLQAAQQAVTLGRSVLMLVPEIALTPQLVAQVDQRFGTQAAVLHSGMTASERWSEWRRIARGEATVVVGVRSAVFAPLNRLGLVVVDEEHDVAYKQQDGARYNARDLAIMRGQMASCPVILGSATPSLESYMHGQAGRYSVVELPERIESRPLPNVEIVDLRHEIKAGNSDDIFSATLRQALIANSQAGKQSLLFLNRRGYANYLQCRLCGEVVTCARCSVSLTFHLRGRVLRCHYCGSVQSAPDHCPACHEPSLEGSGFGTEQVEETLRHFLPEVRTARLDRDSVSRRGVLTRVLKAWRAHEIDILIGTQMVAKGHDVPGVTLVGVLRADSSLNFPDFRAAERTFQLLTQVAGRAGRGQEKGRVIIQTYMPQHYSVRFAARQDFARFATQELRYRKRLGYPPFTRMVNIRCEGTDGEKVKACAERLAKHLVANAQEIQSGVPVVLGPAPAPLERLKGRERWQVLVKGEDRRVLHALVKKTYEEVLARNRVAGVRIIVDVDPYDML